MKVTLSSHWKKELISWEILLIFSVGALLFWVAFGRTNLQILKIPAVLIFAEICGVLYCTRYARYVVYDKNEIGMYSHFHRKMSSVNTLSDVYYETVVTVEAVNGNPLMQNKINCFVMLSDSAFKPISGKDAIAFSDLVLRVDSMANAVLAPYDTNILARLSGKNFHEITAD